MPKRQLHLQNGRLVELWFPDHRTVTDEDIAIFELIIELSEKHGAKKINVAVSEVKSRLVEKLGKKLTDIDVFEMMKRAGEIQVCFSTGSSCRLH